MLNTLVLLLFWGGIFEEPAIADTTLRENTKKLIAYQVRVSVLAQQHFPLASEDSCQTEDFIFPF